MSFRAEVRVQRTAVEERAENVALVGAAGLGFVAATQPSACSGYLDCGSLHANLRSA